MEQIVSADGFAADEDGGIGFFDAVAAWINAAPMHVVAGTMTSAPWGDAGQVEVHREGVSAVVEDLRGRYASVVVGGSLDLDGSTTLGTRHVTTQYRVRG
ncbi:hypothetical protein SFC79_10285 [Nocardioides sp. S-58]|uniref:Uncharacterized protein n=1 Tax=Nocardioides renjunii TaxID=3095075 RepID=A0ABU5KB15_9ACTN|nr:hypothetical protein [Nocardioides sp. S-58]MDZ5662151.1 hypothetical protein [Nocardioides sp. S-58]